MVKVMVSGIFTSEKFKSSPLTEQVRIAQNKVCEALLGGAERGAEKFSRRQSRTSCRVGAPGNRAMAANIAS
jgi:hypothetical protein